MNDVERSHGSVGHSDFNCVALLWKGQGGNKLHNGSQKANLTKAAGTRWCKSYNYAPLLQL